MKLGMQMLFQNPGTMSDEELYRRELKVAELAEPKGFKGRTYCVAMSPDSVPLAAELEAVMMVFSQFSPETVKPTFDTYRERWRQCHGVAAPAPLFVDFMYCDEDAGRAEEKSRKNIAAYLMSVFKHYEMFADHFRKARGYEAYAKSS